MTQPKAVVFDLLTALLDSWSVWDAAAGTEEGGRRWRARYLELTYGCGAYRPYEMLVAEAAREAGLPPSAPDALHAGWDRLQPWPEAPALLRDLKARGMLLGVATNCSVELGRRAAARCGVPFDAVITSEEAGFYKPRPEPYRAVLAALGVEPQDALFVAGSSADVPGAAGVGMAVVWHNRVGLPARPGPAPLRESRTLDVALEGLA
ncbi:HAD family hydrolase [Roseomonas sp. KE2513]|uniref:HAD family hydrolase n=1 Tax=Roseomonas sp. KE2513 TaxID=2479202 RepID=UPI0018E0106A|nr:HAD-IA family hydrolase [Roseomonas sp. KE2513]MBI0539427.1 HAD family hydrolase [Roseomonas sp. KE2513]